MGGYIETVQEFEFLPGVLQTLAQLKTQFGKIFVVTNQQGIGKGIMTHEQLSEVHQYMCQEVKKSGGHIEQVYYAPQLASEESDMRKPGIGMAVQVQNENPDVNFQKAIMVGDTDSDIIFGKNAGMKTVFVQTSQKKSSANPDFVIPTLNELTTLLQTI